MPRLFVQVHTEDTVCIRLSSWRGYVLSACSAKKKIARALEVQTTNVLLHEKGYRYFLCLWFQSNIDVSAECTCRRKDLHFLEQDLRHNILGNKSYIIWNHRQHVEFASGTGHLSNRSVAPCICFHLPGLQANATNRYARKGK